jgi:hypothetical protein
MKSSREPGANTEQAAMLREWYRDVIEQAAFVFVEDTRESEHFLTVHMGNGHNHQQPYYTSGARALESLEKAIEMTTPHGASAK